MRRGDAGASARAGPHGVCRRGAEIELCAVFASSVKAIRMTQGALASALGDVRGTGESNNETRGRKIK
jgi:hypothetical protein